MLFPYLCHCPSELKGILYYDQNGKLCFVFGDKYISLEMLKALTDNIGSKTEKINADKSK